jgi:DNA mismatch endonuclease (patch repair protein)
MMKPILWIFLSLPVMDNLTREQRRKNMQNIRSVGTQPELSIMRELKRKKIYFASHAESITGKPDIVFRRKKIAVFIDSDFWHGHPKRCIMPQTNIEYWSGKIARNRKRDKEVNHILRKAGWVVIRLWEHDVKNRFEKCINIILKALEKENGAHTKQPIKADRKGVTKHYL